MIYSDTLAYLYKRLPMFQRIGNQAFKKDLTNITKLMSAMKNPHRQFKTIHIAGTNGKGSVTHILAALLMGSGLKVGLYTSPHYRDFRERIKINGQLIPKRKVSRFVQNNKHTIEQIEASFFEVTVAMAFRYFADEEVDVALIETGLGGRLDSTNIITPLLSIITNISLDHQNILGDTLPKIAFEKAGIIKQGIPVLIGEKQKEVLPVFRRKAKEVDAPLFLAEKNIKINIQKRNYSGLHGTLTIKDKKHNFHTDVSGAYQSKNLRTALAAFSLLDNTSLPLLPFNPSWLRDIRIQTHYIGRWTILGESPLIIAESAHNKAGLKLLTAEIKTIPYQNLYFIIGTVNDKDPSYLFDILPKKAYYHFAKANIPRGLEAKRLQAIAETKGVKGKSYSTVRHALNAAKRKAQANDLIIVAGSIFVVAEVV